LSAPVRFGESWARVLKLTPPLSAPEEGSILQKPDIEREKRDFIRALMSEKCGSVNVGWRHKAFVKNLASLS
jgi:hypothetical protein